MKGAHMKIIDETGIVLTTEPDLEAGYLVEDVEVVHHDAVEGTAPQWHRETAKLPDGSLAIYYRDGKEIGRDMVKVIDVPGVDPQPAWDEEVPVMRYIRYTTKELAQRKEQAEAARKRQEALDKLPETLEALTAAQTDTDSLMVDQEYRLTLLELGITE
jgi:hypothetical protein